MRPGREPTLTPPVDPIVGIDLGTTNSVVALAAESGRVRVLEDAVGRRVQPSVVSFHPNGSVLVGTEARDRRIVDSRNTVYSAKRLIGRTVDMPEVAMLLERLPYIVAEDREQQPVIQTRAGDFNVVEISAIVLDYMRDLAERDLGTEVHRAVVTVPANFSDAQRAATVNAGAIAGIEVPHVINEPTAAALAYGHQHELEDIIAVYDFGGGTFDITIVKLARDVYEVLGTAGHPFLGGEDIDQRLTDVMVDMFLRKHRVDLSPNRAAMQRLRSVAEKIKIQLSRRTRTVVEINEIAYGTGGTPLSLHLDMSREQFQGHIKDIVEATFPVCREAARMAGLAPTNVQEVLLVGGTTRVPYIRERVAGFFQRAPRTDLKPEEAIAMGAALQGMALRQALGVSTRRKRKSVLERYTPMADRGGEKTPGAGGGDAGTGEHVRRRVRAPTFDVQFGSEAEDITYVPPVPSDIQEDSLDVALPRTSGAANLGESLTDGLLDADDGYPSKEEGNWRLDSLFDNMPTQSADDSSGSESLDNGFSDESSVSSSTHKLGQIRQTLSGRIDLSTIEESGIELDLASLLEGGEHGASSPLSMASEQGLGEGLFEDDAGRDLSEVSGELDAAITSIRAPKADSPFLGGIELDLEPLSSMAPDAPARPDSIPTAVLPVPRQNERAGSDEIATVVLPDPRSPRGIRSTGGDETPITEPQPILEASRGAIPKHHSLGHIPAREPLRTTQVPIMAVTQAMLRQEDERVTLTRNAADSGNRGAVPAIIEVMPRGIGVGTVSGYCDVLIPRNERVPTSVTRVFTTSKDGQDTVRILVFEGDSRRIADNIVLGELLLEGIAPRPRGETHIEVVFEIDASGILRVGARDSATGQATETRLNILGRSSQAEVEASADRLRQILG